MYSRKEYIQSNKKQEPKFKVGDWVRLTIFNKTIHQITRLSPSITRDCTKPHLSNFNGNLDCTDSFELWEQQVGEWCVFWDDKYDSYIIARFHGISDDGLNKFKTDFRSFDNIAPLEFAGTLKDK